MLTTQLIRFPRRYIITLKGFRESLISHQSSYQKYRFVNLISFEDKSKTINQERVFRETCSRTNAVPIEEHVTENVTGHVSCLLIESSNSIDFSIDLSFWSFLLNMRVCLTLSFADSYAFMRNFDAEMYIIPSTVFHKKHNFYHLTIFFIYVSKNINSHKYPPSIDCHVLSPQLQSVLLCKFVSLWA